ncbi:MAG: aspartate aminotransferase family protein, partial [Chloroflexota bacterium]
YGLASYFHTTLGTDVPRPTKGSIEWTGESLPPRTPQHIVGATKRGLLNHGVDLMSGTGGFTSGVHTTDDIDRTVAAFEATIDEMKADGLF